MNPPVPIADFFRMKNEYDDDGLLSLFNDDATVVDGGEGRRMQGADEIKKWIQKAISGLKLHTEIKNCKEQRGEWIVDTVMTGDSGQPGTVRVFHYSACDRFPTSASNLGFTEMIPIHFSSRCRNVLAPGPGA